MATEVDTTVMKTAHFAQGNLNNTKGKGTDTLRNNNNSATESKKKYACMRVP